MGLIADINVKDVLEYLKDIYGPLVAYHDATNYFEKLKGLRSFYLKNEQRILNAKDGQYAFSAYAVDWTRFFTPIEYRAWCSIRCKGAGMVFYPQYPALNYFLDFANPKKKIAIELDGKNYHDPKRDRDRDRALREIGWTVYRITGSEMSKSNYMDFSDCTADGLSEDESRDHIYNWITGTGDGVIEAIGATHFWRDNRPEWFYTYCELTLNNHKLIH